MSEERLWPGTAACWWENKTDPISGKIRSRLLLAPGLGPIAEVIVDGPAFVIGQHPDWQALSRRLPGRGTKAGAFNAVEGIYGSQPGHLPTRDDFALRWQAWMEGRPLSILPRTDLSPAWVQLVPGEF